ncbi:MAG: hypothetical protein ACLGSD_11100 [Acidobacteriota bacterium]
MKKLIFVLAAFALHATAQSPAPPPIVLSPAIPGDVTITAKEVSIDAFQPDFDVYSWNTFIALNWPVGPDGNADPNQKIGAKGDNDTVWEHYRDVRDVFLPGGKRPTWNGPAVMPPVPVKGYRKGMPVLSQIAKTPHVLTDSSQPFNTGPLIDQNGYYTRFQILINKTMFDYILNNSLYSKAGQKVFTPPVNFTCGSLASGTKPEVEGAIMVKSSWKVIKPSEKSRFHSEEAVVCSPPEKEGEKPICQIKLMGLVGLHIAHKTQDASQWLWSTFEHVDNAPTAEDVKSGNLKAKYNYYNPKCGPKICPANQIPPRPWIPAEVSSFHSQVVRNNLFNLPIYAASAAARNSDARALFVGVNPHSVWQNYELISTMWPTNPGNCAAVPGDPLGTPAPTFMANTTLETYLQKNPPQPNVTSQCIECHNNATMTVPVPSDFTYILQRAQ